MDAATGTMLRTAGRRSCRSDEYVVWEDKVRSGEVVRRHAGPGMFAGSNLAETQCPGNLSRMEMKERGPSLRGASCARRRCCSSRLGDLFGRHRRGGLAGMALVPFVDAGGPTELISGTHHCDLASRPLRECSSPDSAPRADTEDELCWGGCGLGADEIRALRAIARQLDAQVYVHSTAGSNDTLCQERDRRPRTQSYGAPPAREGVRGFEPRRPGTLLYHVQEKAPSSRGASTNGGSPGRLWPADEGLHSRAPPARKTRALAGHSRGTRTKTDSPRHHWHRSGHPWTPAGQKSS
ncbi:hypothetical protein LXA43DRAFT_394221 [Ganoderma leucocontextum]|nr:hypothetical protein LXA43DRAFT_394221 [Ganoderma leucocontextum]